MFVRIFTKLFRFSRAPEPGSGGDMDPHQFFAWSQNRITKLFDA
jgi:hypothetical protein